MVRRLAAQFNHCVHRESLDTLEEEFCLYQTTRDIPSDILSEDQVVIYWGKIGEMKSTTTGSVNKLGNNFP